MPLPVCLVEVRELLAGLSDRLAQSRGSVRGWVLTVAEAAGYMGARPQRIYDRVSAGLLEPAKDGTRSLFKRAWLDAYVTGGGES